jgi:hypothetical protein
MEPIQVAFLLDPEDLHRQAQIDRQVWLDYFVHIHTDSMSADLRGHGETEDESEYDNAGKCVTGNLTFLISHRISETVSVNPENSQALICGKNTHQALRKCLQLVSPGLSTKIPNPSILTLQLVKQVE